MKKVTRKDFYMEIRKSPGRFISIFFIVALGVAFFSGIRSSEPSMRITGDSYYDAQNLMDIKAVSTLGITDDDIEAIEKLKGVEYVEGAYSADFLNDQEDEEKTLHVMSISDELNLPEVTEGRMPEKAGECLVDDEEDYEIGDVIELKSGDDDKVSDKMATDTLTVVGTGSSPCYISFNRGSTTIGTGSISAFVLVTADTFDMDCYTEAYVRVEGAEELQSYSDEYQDLIDDVMDEIDGITDERGQIRRTELVDDATKELDDAKQELEDKKKETQEKLDDAADEIADGKKQIQDAKQEIADGWSEISSAKATLNEKQAELDEGLQEYKDGKKELEKGKKTYEAAYKKFQKQKKAAEAEISEGEAALQAARDELDQGWAGYEKLTAQISQVEAAEPEKPSLEETDEGYAEAMATYQEAYQTWYTQLVTLQKTAEATKTQLDAGEASYKTEYKKNYPQLQAAKKQLEEGETKLQESKSEIEANEKKLEEAYETITSGQKQIDSGWAEIKTNEQKLIDGEAEIKENEEKLADAEKEYQEGKEEAEEKIKKAEKKIRKAEREIRKIDEATWYVYDRSTLPEYTGYGENADRMKSLGKVFPVIFFLVAALISLTSMTRMVEEQRISIGTMKALGYSSFTIAKKYIGYALLATIGGSIFGVLVGEKIIPYIIIYAYGIMYHHMDNILVPYNLYYALWASGISVVCIVVATLAACYKELQETPAALMRPPSPKHGQRVLLERIPVIWRHLNFSWKSTVRNLLRYKKRFFMTIFGISGCMGLMLFGFGLKDSIYEITQLQYKEIQVYKGMIYLQDDAQEDELKDLYSYLDTSEDVTDYMETYMKSVTVMNGKRERVSYVTVLSDLNKAPDYIHFRDRVSHEGYTLDDDGVIISEKTARLLNVSAGDTIEIKDEDNGNKQVKISHIMENYMGHYLYFTPAYYEEVFGEAPEYNCVLFKTPADYSVDQVEDLGLDIMKQDAVLSINYMHDIQEQLDNLLSSLNLVIMVLIVSAGMLAFVVLYNLNEVNITERQRELATLKVLGFFDPEVGMYVYRENLILTLFGAAGGCIFGKYLHTFTIETVEVDSAMFGRVINGTSYLYALFFTILFAVIVNVVMYFKLKKIDMVESLKSIE